MRITLINVLPRWFHRAIEIAQLDTFLLHVINFLLLEAGDIHSQILGSVASVSPGHPCELVGRARSEAPPQPAKLESLGMGARELGSNKVSYCVWWKFEKHCHKPWSRQTVGFLPLHRNKPQAYSLHLEWLYFWQVKIETFLVPEALLLCQGPEAVGREMQTSLGWKGSWASFPYGMASCHPRVTFNFY